MHISPNYFQIVDDIKHFLIKQIYTLFINENTHMYKHFLSAKPATETDWWWCCVCLYRATPQLKNSCLPTKTAASHKLKINRNTNLNSCLEDITQTHAEALKEGFERTLIKNINKRWWPWKHSEEKMKCQIWEMDVQHARYSSHLVLNEFNWFMAYGLFCMLALPKIWMNCRMCECLQREKDKLECARLWNGPFACWFGVNVWESDSWETVWANVRVCVCVHSLHCA